MAGNSKASNYEIENLPEQSCDFDLMDSCTVRVSNKEQPNNLILQNAAMVTSISSSAADTPGDSGVLCLGSDISELTSDSNGFMTLSVAEAEDIACDSSFSQPKNYENYQSGETSANMMTQSDIDNQNITPPEKDSSMPEMVLSSLPKSVDLAQRGGDNLPDVVLKAYQTDMDGKVAMDQSFLGELEPNHCKTQKSESDDIVFRRKCRKKPSGQTQKKRVSFHEDILNSTRTDNIHIERGLISYNDQFDKGRNSWCVTNGMSYESESNVDRRVKSDVLTYGHTEVFAEPDNSGIYEYKSDSTVCLNQNTEKKTCPCNQQTNLHNSTGGDKKEFYVCNCNESDSNLSTESESSNSTQSLSLETSNTSKDDGHSYDPRKKSYSCDCIENDNCKTKMHKMYFSEGDIAKSDLNTDDTVKMKHISNSGKVKKSSLKKKRYIPTNIVEEHSIEKNTEEPKSATGSRNIFGSLKSMYKTINFGLETTQRGLLEGTEDGESVLDVISDSDKILSSENKIGKNMISFLSKSFDTGFYKDDAVMGEIDDDPHSFEADDGLYLADRGTSYEDDKSEMLKPKLTLDVHTTNPKNFVDWKSDLSNQISARNKFIVNCESTVYEHKGLSYCYQHDTFQTAFDTVKESFTPIKDSQVNKIYDSQEKPEEFVQNSQINKKMDTSVQTKKERNNSIDKTSVDSNSYVGESTQMKVKNIKDLQEDNVKVLSKHLSSPLRNRGGVRNDKFTYKVTNPCTDKIKTVFSNSNSNCESSSTSLKDTSVDDIEVDESLEIVDATEIALSKHYPHKSSLISRFLRNVCQKKALDAKLKNNAIYQKKLYEEKSSFPSISLPSFEKISSTFKVSAKKVDRLINKEIMENKRVSIKLITADEPSYFDSFEENVAMECCEKLKLELFSDSSEILHRMLKVRTQYSMLNGEWTPLLVFITDKAFYVADVKPGNAVYNLVCHLPLEQLDTIVVGPDSQYVQIMDTEKILRCTLITGDRYLCHRLVSSLEWSARVSRACQVQSSVVWKENYNIRKALAEATSGETNFTYYGMVTLGYARDPVSNGFSKEGCNIFSSPSEGYLMYKLEKQKQWQASYFVLKSGKLQYGMHSPSEEPANSIDLSTVLGVRRYADPLGRPHCFEIAQPIGAGCICLAAADEQSASQWLQSLLMHAAQALEGPKSQPQMEEQLPPSCTLVTTSSHIITLREDTESWFKRRQESLNSSKAGNAKQRSDQVEILSCASVKNLTAFKIPDCEDNWCLLEFNVCEVREQDAEMGIIFTSSTELERFISTVESLWHMTNEGVFPVSMTDGWNNECSTTHAKLVTAWDYMLPVQR